LLKNAPKKSYKQNKFDENEKSAYFRHVFANNFFWCVFSKLFQRIQNQREILRFLTPFSIKKKKKILGHNSTFSHFDCTCPGNGSKKGKIFFYECILEFNYATIKGFA
jgi:hypothetical protein